MTKQEELQKQLTAIEAERTQLFNSIQPKMASLATEAKILRDELEILAVERLQSLTIEQLADPLTFLEASELLWNEGRGIYFEHEVLRGIFGDTYLYGHASFHESYEGDSPRYLAGFSASIPLRTDEEKFARTAEVAAHLLRAAYEVDSERAYLELITDSESYVSPKIRYDGSLFALYSFGSSPDFQHEELAEVLKRADRSS